MIEFDRRLTGVLQMDVFLNSWKGERHESSVRKLLFYCIAETHIETMADIITEKTYERFFREQPISRFVKWVPKKISLN